MRNETGLPEASNTMTIKDLQYKWYHKHQKNADNDHPQNMHLEASKSNEMNAKLRNKQNDIHEQKLESRHSCYEPSAYLELTAFDKDIAREINKTARRVGMLGGIWGIRKGAQAGRLAVAIAKGS